MKEPITIQEETDTTLPEGVEEQSSEDVKERPVLARDKTMEEIAKKRREQTALDSDASDEDEDELIDLKVDGETIQKTRGEVNAEGGVAGMQKSLSAEKRLKEASIARKQAEEYLAKQAQFEQRLIARERALEEKMQALSASTESKAKELEEASGDLDGVADKFLESVYSGDEGEAKANLVKIMKSLSGPKVAPAAQINEAELLKRALFEVDKRNGQREFSEKFSHLKEDKFFFDRTNYETVEIINANPDMSPRDVIMMAAKKVDALYQEKFGKAEVMDKRVKDKENLDTVQSARAKKQPDNAYKPKTKDDIFEMYRKNRAR